MSLSTRVAGCVVAGLAAASPGLPAATHLFTHAEVHPVSSPPIADGAVLVRDGRIVAVGPAADIDAPDGATVHDLTGKVLIPGMVDTHSHIGSPSGGDSSGPLHPGVRSLDAIDVHSDSFWRARVGGITTLNVMPGSGHLMSGQTTYLKLRANPRAIEDWLLCDDPVTGICGSMKLANGTNSLKGDAFPGTRARAAADLRALFHEARAYMAKQARAADGDAEAPDVDLGLEAVAEVLRGERRVQFHSHRHNDIRTVVRLADEFGFTPVIQHGTDAWKLADLLAERGIPVSITYLDSPGGKEEILDWRMDIGVRLVEAGVDLSINTDDYVTDSRRFLRYGAMNVRAGMDPARALEALTLAGARHLGLAERVGSLEPGKDADLVVLSGAPFATRTHVEETWVEGERIYARSNPDHYRYVVGGDGVYSPDGLEHGVAGHGHTDNLEVAR